MCELTICRECTLLLNPHSCTVSITTEPPLVNNKLPFCPDGSQSAVITCVVDERAVSLFHILPKIVTTEPISCDIDNRDRLKDFDIMVLICNTTMIQFQQLFTNGTCGRSVSCLSAGIYSSPRITFQPGKVWLVQGVANCEPYCHFVDSIIGDWEEVE